MERGEIGAWGGQLLYLSLLTLKKERHFPQSRFCLFIGKHFVSPGVRDHPC